MMKVMAGSVSWDAKEPDIDPQELEILEGIIDKAQCQKPLATPKLGNKQGSAHLNGSAVI